MTIKAVNYEENRRATMQALNDYTTKRVPQLIHNHEELSFVFEEDGEIIGRIVGYIHWDHLQVDLFCVNDDVQSKGIGSILLGHMEEIARAENCHYVLLETMSFNAPRFYEKHGYQVLAAIADSPVVGETRFFFKKDL
jgi:ribosomal protein S18 acetylase RimI-like enzyme